MFYRGLIYSIQEGLLTLRRNMLITLLSIVTIAVSFTILGIFMFIAVNVGAMAESYGDSLIVHCFFADDADEQTIQGHIDRLKEDKRILKINFVDKDQAADRFLELFPDDAELLESLEYNPLPSSIEIEMKEENGVGNEKTELFVRELESLPGVDSVLFDRQWVDSLESISRWTAYAGLFLGLLLLIAAVVTASNIIKINILSRREEIEIMRLVGAENIFVKGPFIFGGLIQGFLASLLSLGLLYLMYHFTGVFIETSNIEVLRGIQVRFLPIMLIITHVLMGPTIGLGAALLSFGRAGRA